MMVLSEYPASRYSDLPVTSDPRDAEQRRQKRHPKLIVDVLSESTAGVDAVVKLAEYQTIAELEEYVLVDSRKPSVRIYRPRGEEFETAPPSISGEVRLLSLAVKISPATIYEDVDFVRATPAP